jgi:hypothetical protein
MVVKNVILIMINNLSFYSGKINGASFCFLSNVLTNNKNLVYSQGLIIVER